jgi:hypothetical protein
MDSRLIRSESIRKAAGLGVAVPASVPLLDADLSLREVEDVAGRLLAMNAVAAVAYGFDKAKAIAWLQQEALERVLTEPERKFIVQGEGAPEPFRAQIEAMWALAWAIGMVSELDFGKECDRGFAARLPNLKHAEPSLALRRRSRLRSLGDVVSACDLAYCLHWAIAQSSIDGVPPPRSLKPNIVIERRRALEWLLSSESWNEISLDT